MQSGQYKKVKVEAKNQIQRKRLLLQQKVEAMPKAHQELVRHRKQEREMHKKQ